MSANFRALFQLQFNQWAKNAKSASELWPLSIDETPDDLSPDEMYKRNEAIIKAYKEKYGIN